jgi:hypothetical protein
LRDIPYNQDEVHYLVQANSSEMTYTSAFDATAVVMILTNLSACTWNLYSFEVLDFCPSFFFWDTVHGIFYTFLLHARVVLLQYLFFDIISKAGTLIVNVWIFCLPVQ